MLYLSRSLPLFLRQMERCQKKIEFEGGEASLPQLATARAFLNRGGMLELPTTELVEGMLSKVITMSGMLLKSDIKKEKSLESKDKVEKQLKEIYAL